MSDEILGLIMFTILIICPISIFILFTKNSKSLGIHNITTTYPKPVDHYYKIVAKDKLGEKIKGVEK